MNLNKMIGFLLVLSIAFCSSNMNVLANNELSNKKPIHTFSYKIDYPQLYNFLGLSEEEYKSKWKSGKTISDMVEERDIPPLRLILYFADIQFKALDQALQVGKIDRDFYHQYAIYEMKDDILFLINRNPNKKAPN
ncbi:hypothetical protein IM538_03900 [Cytobacillus suaedae]|nr:hypothetical protein IM538_03900 [Cytobacillus suaedae]